MSPPLAAHYPLDEDSGSTANGVAGSNDGTVNGATMGATGILGTSCYSFDGADDYISIGSPLSYTEFTVTAWLKTTGFDSTYQRAVSNMEGGGSGGFLIGIQNSNEWTFQVGNGSFVTIFSNVSTDTNWHHLAGHYDGSTMRLFVDGVEEAQNGTSYNTSSTNLRIGESTHTSGGHWDGNIDDVRIYDHALTPQEVAYLYSASNRGDYMTAKL